MTTPYPDYHEWVAYCFEQGYSDFHEDEKTADEPKEVIWEREERFCGRIPYDVLTEYGIRLFEQPAFLIEKYTDQQITEGVWFLFGSASEYFHDFRDKVVPTDNQLALMHSVATMYTDLFDRVCNRHGKDPDEDCVNELPLDVAVFMIWDMSCIEGPLCFPKDHPHLVDPSFDVLETALFKCRTSTCKLSALHGLGEVQRKHQERVHELIDRFLDQPDQPEFLREYAVSARSGDVL